MSPIEIWSSSKNSVWRPDSDRWPPEWWIHSALCSSVYCVVEFRSETSSYNPLHEPDRTNPNRHHCCDESPRRGTPLDLAHGQGRAQEPRDRKDGATGRQRSPASVEYVDEGAQGVGRAVDERRSLGDGRQRSRG